MSIVVNVSLKGGRVFLSCSALFCVFSCAGHIFSLATSSGLEIHRMVHFAA